MLTPDQVQRLAAELESDRVERKRSLSNSDDIRAAICAMANDLNGLGTGYLLFGVEDDGRISGLQVSDDFLRRLGSFRDDGQIQPRPSLHPYVLEVTTGVSVAVLEVTPSDDPPVRAGGRVWVRVGPRRSSATPDEERRLNERRVVRTRTFDQRPCRGATLEDLDLDAFRRTYLPSAIAPDVLEQNQRSIEHQLAALRLFDPAAAVPTNAGILVLGFDPLAHIPGAYVQVTRFESGDLSSPVVDAKKLTGNLLTQLRELDLLLPLQVRTARVPVGGMRYEDRPDYPLPALRELVLNAIMHRNYETTSAPVRINWFDDRVEIQNPGGLYGQVTPNNFDRVTDYRNPVLGEAMKVLGYVERYGTGIARARAELARNGSSAPEFTFEPTHVQVTVKARA